LAAVRKGGAEFRSDLLITFLVVYMFWAHILDVSLIFILQRKGTQMHIINTQRIRPALDIYKYDLIDTKTMLSDGSGVDNRMFGKDSVSIALILGSNRWPEIVVLVLRVLL